MSSVAAKQVLNQPELLTLIVGHLDKKTLPVALRISPSFFHAVDPILYRDITINFKAKSSPLDGYDIDPSGRSWLSPKGQMLPTVNIKATLFEHVKIVRLLDHSVEDHASVNWRNLTFPNIEALRICLPGDNPFCKHGFKICPALRRIRASKLVLDSVEDFGAIDYKLLPSEVEKVVCHCRFDFDYPFGLYRSDLFRDLPSSVHRVRPSSRSALFFATFALLNSYSERNAGT